MSSTEFRVNVLSGHLLAAQGLERWGASVPHSSPQSSMSTEQGSRVCLQACAATNTLMYARPASLTLFARPAVDETPCIAYIEALGAAGAALCPSSSLSPSSTFTQAPPSAIEVEQAAQDPPLYARAATTATTNNHVISPPSSSSSSFPLSSPIEALSPSASGDWTPSTTVEENEFGWCLQVLLPGVKAHDVRAELMPGRRLVISGRRGVCRGAYIPELLFALPEVFGSPGGGVHASRDGVQQGMASGGYFQVVWNVPGTANLDSLYAEVKDGCLLVKVSKRSVLSLL